MQATETCFGGMNNDNINLDEPLARMLLWAPPNYLGSLAQAILLLQNLQ